MIRTRLKQLSITSVFIFWQLEYNFCTPINLEGLPLKSDVDNYLNTIEQLLKTCEINKKHMNLNFYFGLVLLNVNLKHAMTTKKTDFPEVLETTLKQILVVDDQLLQYYESTHPDTSKHPEYSHILSMFKHHDALVKNLGRYDSHNHEVTFKTKEELQQKYPAWSAYKKRVTAKLSNVPTPYQSDKCMASLAGNSINYNGSPYKCTFSQKCYNVVANGTAMGYALSHRLLALLGATKVWGCYIFSPRVDEQMITNFCTDMFDEAQYIAAFGLHEGIDLLMEQVALCSVFGHPEFLQRSWLDATQDRRRSTAYFHPIWPLKDADPQIRGMNEELIKQKSDVHYRAVAAGALGAAVRFILETHY